MSDALPELKAAVVSALRSRLRGATLLPADALYGAARHVWNGAIDRHPSAIIVCADAEDVSLAVRIAADNGLPLTIRGGGHNVAGRSIRDGVLLLDLSRLRNVAVNRELQVATVQGGAQWRDVDAATTADGLATTGGLVSSTGVGGFTLGGGAGVVLADGRFVTASPDEHTELFWGLRGGAGGLGVVTSFEFQLHPLREVLVGLVIHPADRGFDALRAFREFAANAPDEFCGIAVLANAPPLPFLDAAWHGKPVVIFALCWSGDMAAGERALAPLRGHGRPLADHVGPMPYAQWQQMQDPAAPAGHFYYWKTANYGTLSDATLEILAASVRQLPTPHSEIHVQHMGGAVARFALDDSAFAHRGSQYFVNFIGVADQANQVDSLRETIRSLHAKASRDALPGVMANFSDQDDTDEDRLFGHRHAAKLAALRRRYDPAGSLTVT
jgi:FAD/FMN-containing dehydrogenase